MGSSYFITYGGNRVTFPGVPGPVAWEHVPLSGYHETLLWSGTWKSDSIQLSGQPSAYSVLRIVPGGANAGGNSQTYNPLEVSWKQLSSTNNLVFENAMFGTTAASGADRLWWFGGQISGCSGTSWTFQYAYGRPMNNTTSRQERYDFAQIREIWGVTYG